MKPLSTYSNTACACLISMISLAFVADADAKRRHKGKRASDPPTNNSQGNGSSDDKTAPILPIGTLSASPTVVQAGTHPTLNWNINHPSIIEDYITVNPPSTIEADKEICYEIRVLGQGVTVSSGNGFSFVPTEASVNTGSGYERIFYGTNHNVKPNQVVYSGQLDAGESLKFAGRYCYYGSWGTHRKSDGGTLNVRCLVNGDIPPDVVPAYDAPSLESFLKPYLGANGKVQIGPMDSIIFMELTHSDSQQSDSGYDLQDMVLLVTFKKCKNNNGHGNNIDGIDSSNPGSAPFINLDTDPNVDDEG